MRSAKIAFQIILLLLTTAFAVDPGGFITESKSGHTLTVHPDRTVVSLKVSSSEYSNWKNDGFNNGSQRNSMSNRLYEYFKDDFDMIYFVLNESSSPEGLSNQLINTSRDFTGMGMTPFNGNIGSVPTGSDGNLNAYVQITRLSNFKNGPTLHEAMHMFGNFTLDDAEQASAEYGTSYHMQHWGYSSSGGPTGGNLGGFTMNSLVNLGGGNWQANDGLGHPNFDGGSALKVNGSPYSYFEMYLAGWYPKDSVDDIRVFKGITITKTGWDDGKFNAASYNDYSIEDLIGSKGARSPGVATSQKDFRILVAVITATDLTTSQWSTITDDVTWFTQKSSDNNSSIYNFWEATRGIATMDASGLYNSLKSTTVTTEYTVTSSVSENGTISPLGSTKVSDGGSQSYSISANSGYEIDSVVVDGANKGSISSYKFSLVTGNHTISASFKKVVSQQTSLSDPSNNLIEWGDWDIDIDTMGSTADSGSSLINNGIAEVSFNITGSDSVADNWAYGSLTTYFPIAKSNNLNNVDSIEVIYRSDSPFNIVLPQPNLSESGASYQTVLPSTNNIFDTIFLAVNNFTQPDWVKDEAALQLPYTADSVTAISFELASPYDGGKGSIDVSELILNHYQGGYDVVSNRSGIGSHILAPKVSVTGRTLNLQLSNIGETKIVVSTVSGRTIKRIEGSFVSGINQIPLGQIASGVYLLQIRNSSFSINKSILIR